MSLKYASNALKCLGTSMLSQDSKSLDENQDTSWPGTDGRKNRQQTMN